ncbi:MAG TPA: hypothetical protein VMM35_00645 [Longimicrobiales bacterium]|nr:hypothetical protein [Longimicrobiales bacterium]
MDDLGPPTGRASHRRPRTREGWTACIAFAALFLLAMPPVTHTVLNRVEPWILGVPFFFAALFAVYVVLIGVLVWALRRGI